MVVRLSVIDEDGSLEAVIGILQETEIADIVDAAKKYNLACLRFISLSYNTFFSYKQQCMIRNEVTVLQRVLGVNNSALLLISQGLVISVQDSFSQLKFEPIEV